MKCLISKCGGWRIQFKYLGYISLPPDCWVSNVIMCLRHVVHQVTDLRPVWFHVFSCVVCRCPVVDMAISVLFLSSGFLSAVSRRGH